MEHNNIPENLIDIFSQGINAEEKRKLEDWIHLKKENENLYWELRDVWQASATVDPSNKYDENRAWEKLRPELKVIKPKRNLNWFKYAAVAVAFTALGSISYYLLTPSTQSVPVSFQEVYVPYGSTSKIILPDGSYVWLNAGSFLKYNNSFNVNNRNVFLKGEAFFDVQKNKQLSFIVQTPGMEVKAIGTKFNVKSYPEEQIISTTVVEGRVQVINQLKASKQNELVLTSNQSASFLKEFTANPVIEPEKNKNTPQPFDKIEEIPSKILEVESDVNIDLFVSWHQGKLLIERERLGSLAVKFERRYNIKILFLDESVKNYVFSGVLKDETFEQVLEVIRLASPLHFIVDGNIVKLSEDKTLRNRLK